MAASEDTGHPPADDRYTARQRELAAGFAGRLRTSCVGAAAVLGSHGLATALISVGVETALAHMAPAEVADWLRGVADELDAEDGAQGSRGGVH